MQNFHRCFLVKLTTFLRTPNLRCANDCFWNLFLKPETTWTVLCNNYGFVCRFCLHYHWYCYNQKNLFQQIWQISQENTCFKDSKDLRSLTLSKNRFRHRCFIVNSGKFFIKPFLKSPSDDWFCINSRSVSFPSTTFVPFQKRCHTYFSAEFFLGLICRLGTRASSIF